MKSLSDIGETEAIRLFCKHFKQDKNVIAGPGDDCAVVRIPGADFDMLFTSDPVIQDVHFTETATPGEIGNKAIGRVLSDIAAMGGKPGWALLNISAPSSTTFAFIDKIGASASRLASKFSLNIVGGDMSENRKIEINVFAAGTVPTGTAVLRTGALAGHIIFVTGVLGGSRAGKHASFVPRVDEGILLRDWATSMTDISDGLCIDLSHLVHNGLGAVLDEKLIPLSDSAGSLQSALFDGEDYELLFTIPLEKKTEFENTWKNKLKTPVTAIGSITEDKGAIKIRNADGQIQNLEAKGYLHFERTENHITNP